MTLVKWLVHSASTCVLLVEDEVLVRMALAADLRMAGFSVVEASTGEEALDYLRSGARVDVVVADTVVPGALDGMSLARTCRRDFPAVPVILTSGRTVVRELVEHFPFMPKPCSGAALVEAVRESLGSESA
jgi:two-component system, response regulator PdtaR